MSEEIVKVIVESGYFYLSTQSSHYPHRRAVWGNRIFVTGPRGTNWGTELLKFRDFIRFSQNYFTQITKMTYWKQPLPLPHKREKEMSWGGGIALWDTGRTRWPQGPTNPTQPHASWSGSSYRGTNYAGFPMPPSVSYRYERLPSLEGRGQYGYLRCIEGVHMQYASSGYGERLPFHIHPSRLAALHASQINEPLTRSGLAQWHTDGNPIREVMLTHREGVTAVVPITGYGPGIITTTARNFSLPML